MAVTVLGKTFESEEERREYFREELRKKLPELKKMEGFPLGEDEDIIELSDPPYYTACPNPWLDDFVEHWETEKEQLKREGIRSEEFEVKSPFAKDISEGKYHPIYRFHPYPTKVPHKAIIHYLLHYTQPGDIVFDGFAGTGMTGVASQEISDKKTLQNLGYKITSNDEIESLEKGGIYKQKLGKRKSIVNDLSPSATFISYNYNTPDQSEALYASSKRLFKEVENETKWMYETLHTKSGKKGIINYTAWSDVFICSNCNEEIVFWDEFVDQEEGKINRSTNCSHCNTKISKTSLDRAWTSKYDESLKKSIRQSKRVPVLINYTYDGSRYTKKPDKNDIELIKKIDDLKIDLWYPTDKLPEGDKTSEPRNVGITNVHHFYSKRNLYCLAKFLSKIEDQKQKLFVTKLAFQITLMYRFTHMSGTWGAGGGPMAGTLYIPSLIKELRILKQLKSAIKQRKKLKTNSELGAYAGSTGSFTSFMNLKANSCDYIFLDPPFGANLNYSELAFLWESWLKCKTNIATEAIQSRSQNKGLFEYRSLISESFKNAFRVLKPGKWMTVEFSNTKAEVWNSIQTAIQQSGFIIANVTGLDKKKGTYNAQNNPTSVKQDLVISCYKPSTEFDKVFNKNKHNVEGVWDFIEEHLKHLPIHVANENSTTAIIERNPKILYDRLVAFYVQKETNVPIDSTDFQKGLRNNFVERDGMFFTNEQVQEYDRKKAEAPNFTQLSILVASEQDGVLWLQNFLKDNPSTYQDIQPEWMQALGGERKGDIIPELKTILEENFLKNDAGEWYVPDPEKEEDLEKLRNRRLLKQFEEYKEQAFKPKGKIKECRVEALRAGFKQSYQDKEFETIVRVGDRIPENLLMEDEVLLQFYDIAAGKV